MNNSFFLFPIFLFSLLITSCNTSKVSAEDSVQKDSIHSVSFDHGVASGDPLTDRVIIWTKLSPSTQRDIAVQWEVAEDKSFSNIIKTGSFTTDSTSNYTVKIDVTGLSAGNDYFYRFSSHGIVSPIGETKTMDNSGSKDLSLGIVSCSNYQFGYFSAYRHLANKDIDIVLHLGDYFYEYGPEGYGDKSFERKHNPPREILSLEDYRTRYAQYRSDKDLQLLHQKHPFITIWDDHEITNDAYIDGAQNHQDDEGDYMIRKAFAKKAYYEWMPIRPKNQDVLYRDFELGPLADIIVLDERLEGRLKPVESTEGMTSEQTMLGSVQLEWFKNKLEASDATWKIIGNQVIFSPLELGKVRPTAPKNLDAWDGYAVERDGIISHIAKNGIDNVVFVTGDTHTSWAFEIPESIEAYKADQSAVAIEFGTPSITSSNWNDSPERTDEMILAAEQLVMQDNPHLKYANARDHGYMILSLSQEEAKAHWYYVDDIKNVESGEGLEQTVSVRKGETQLVKQ
jgi:alkaline phosphatase D